jgi:hypothetical protein
MNSPLCYAEILDPMQMKRTPSRPLGALSSFVCDTQPDLCMQIEQGNIERTQLSRDIEKAVDSITANIRDLHRDDLMLAFLDCGMSEGAIGRFKLMPPNNLAHLTEDLADKVGQAPGLRYEPLIRANPLDTDPRLFSPEHGKGELLFYHVHLRIERVAAAAVQTMRSILQRLNVPTVENEEEIAADIGTLSVASDAIRDYLQVLIDDMPVEDFAAIRAYFNNATRTATGPSGKDSAGIFVLDALAVGDDPDMRAFLESKMETKLFYPTTTVASDAFAGQTDMLDALEQSADRKTLLHLSRLFPSLSSPVTKLLHSMHAVRAKHMAVGKRFLPDAFKPDAPIFHGTGGVGDFPTYLKIPIHILNRMRHS